MSQAGLVCVLTTVQEPTPCVLRLADAIAHANGTLIVIGDRKGPARFDLPAARFLSLDVQARLKFHLAPLLPVGHYARKNLGYLLALEANAACIYETDDDNMPSAAWQPRALRVPVQTVAARSWMNVYRVFSDENIWPRGFPLDCIADPKTYFHDTQTTCATATAPIQQGLADRAPDVDAVWRLTFGHEVSFRPGASLLLPPDTWCPFNSQSTWWWPAAYPLLYLPSHCSFRMTDIWRSFIAQRCLWELGHGIVFHGPEVIQDRNLHRLMNDFRDEIPGYLQNQNLVDTLQSTKLDPSIEAMPHNLVRCYDALISAGIFPAQERSLVQAWCEDVRVLTRRPSLTAAA